MNHGRRSVASVFFNSLLGDEIGAILGARMVLMLIG
jgi:ethanolamine ammonia-lyase small subunit